MTTGMNTIGRRWTALEWDLTNSLLCWVGMFLGEDLLAWLTLAIGGALLVGNAVALMRPRAPKEGELARPPLARTVIQMTIGLVATVWALASLVSP
jgi:hypothetical protein